MVIRSSSDKYRAEMAAGCSRSECHADAHVFGDPESLGRLAAFQRSLLEAEELRGTADELGMDAAELSRLADEFAVWCARADAIHINVWSAGIGWVD